MGELDAKAVLEQKIEAVVAALVQEGTLDDQFIQLRQLEDDSSPYFVYDVVELYFEDSVLKLDKMAAMLASPAPDYNELDQLVHQFKGSSASLGAAVIAKLCVQLRELCHAQNHQGCLALLAQMQQAYTVLKSQLGTFIQLEEERKTLHGDFPSQ